MIKFEKVQMRVAHESEDKTEASLEILPLVRGWGHTLGTAYRRVLMSSVRGTAVTFVDFRRVEFKGEPIAVLHEYQTLPGVRETVMEIAQNFRACPFRLKNEETVAILSLSANKAGKVVIGMAKCPPEVEVINPDVYLFQLEKGAEIELSIGLRENRGFISSPELRPSEVNPEWKGSFPTGVVRVDADHSPVLGVYPETEPFRVGESGDYEKLTLRIRVREGYTAEAAFREANGMLQEHFTLLNDKGWPQDLGLLQPIPRENPAPTPTPLSELELTDRRVLNALFANGIDSVEGLLSFRKQELRQLNRIGDIARKKIETAVENAGLKFRDN